MSATTLGTPALPEATLSMSALLCQSPAAVPVPLVSGLDLETRRGEVIALIGPNGAGKSTLLRCLTGLQLPAAGRITLNGIELGRVDLGERARGIAYLPQRIQAPAELRAHDIVMLGRAPHRSWLAGPSPGDRTAVAEALERCDALSLAQRRIGSLSGGERQRVMLARMLATQAPLLVLDEPTTALDIGHSLRLLSVLGELAAAGASVIIAVHELDYARRFADRVLCIHGDGRGTHTLGAADEVLIPEVLDASFGVRTQLHPDGLRFDLP